MSKVLIIDDDETVLELLENIFAGEGYATYPCIRAMEIEHIVQIEPDLIILDFLLYTNHETVWPLLQELRRDCRTRKIPIVLCTVAYQEVSEIGEYLQEHHIPVVFKPFDLDNLLQVVQQAQMLAISHQI